MDYMRYQVYSFIANFLSVMVVATCMVVWLLLILYPLKNKIYSFVDKLLGKNHDVANDFIMSIYDDMEERNKIADKYNLPRMEDIVGLSDIKKDLRSLMDVFVNADKYVSDGIYPPVGILFCGDSGCGKTMLAKAIAREYNINFMAVSAGDLCSEYRIHNDTAITKLFEDARKNTPCIIFIDEIDIFGSKTGFDSDYKKYVSKLLSEMDGIKQNTGVLVIGATNNPQMLDKALLRAGRFTRRYMISPPVLDSDVLEVINKYFNKKMLDGISDEVLIRLCRGLSPATIKAMFEIAGTNALMKPNKLITQTDLVRVRTELLSGETFLSQSRYSRNDIELRIARHEVGHALVSKYFDRVVEGVNIIGFSYAAGLTLSSDDNTGGLMPLSYYREEIMVIYGGLACEEVYYGRDGVSPGCSSDIDSATSLLLYLCKKLPLFKGDYISIDKRLTDGDYASSTGVTEFTLEMAEKLYTATKNILEANRDCCDKLVDMLVEKKELSSLDLENFYNDNILTVVDLSYLENK